MEAQRRFPDLRILYTTGHTSNAIIHHGVLDHDVQLLTKPFSMTALANKVREAIVTVSC
jgi:hypothetical protein